MSTGAAPISLSITADPRLARLVRMTAANVATLSSMSVDRVEDIRMAAEEAFIYACSVQPHEALSVTFDVDEAHVSMTFGLAGTSVQDAEPAGEAAYADLILGTVCDTYEKIDDPTSLVLTLKADV